MKQVVLITGGTSGIGMALAVQADVTSAAAAHSSARRYQALSDPHQPSNRKKNSCAYL
jgi:NADP-dependent 3-hydroxy acid dehydrogenase YdfG